MSRATINREPKIRMAKENLCLLPKQQLFLFARLMSDHVYLFISRNHLLQQYLFRNFLLVIVTNNVFLLANFLNKLNAEPSLQNQLS